MTQLEDEVTALMVRVERLETMMQELANKATTTNILPLCKPFTHAEFSAWLKAQGLMSELPPEAQKHIDEWRDLPESEKQETIDYFRNLVLDPPLSQIIIDERR